MFKCTQHIVIGKYKLSAINQVVIQSSWQTLTDTCVIRLGRNVKDFSKKRIETLIKKGDKVTIDIGYDDKHVRRFTGYVNDVRTGAPLEIHCEDSMYLLKRKAINYSATTPTLKQLIKAIVPSGIKTNVLNATVFSSVRYSEMTPAQILKELQQVGIYSYFKNDVLHVGFVYDLKKYKTHQFDFDKNVKLEQMNLQYLKADDKAVSVKATSFNLTNDEVYTVTVGDAGGETRTLHYTDLSKEDLEKQAKAQLPNFKYDGYRGSFDAFLVPFVEHGDVTELFDSEYPEHTGGYFVDAVATYYGVERVGQKITIGKTA